MISKVMPFLNKLIPSGLAFKGLSKINPKIGKYLTAATAAGYGAEEALGYLREQLGGESPDQNLRPDEMAANARVEQAGQIPRAIGKAAQIGAGAAGIGAVGAALPQVIGGLFGGGQGGPEQPQPQAPEKQQPVDPSQFDIAQYSPDLQAFIEHWLGQGEEPGTVASIAKNSPKENAKYKDAISQIEQATGMDFVELISRMYQGVNKAGRKAQQAPQAAMAQQGQPQGQVPALAQQAGASAQQRQPTENEINLTKALQDLTKRLGK